MFHTLFEDRRNDDQKFSNCFICMSVRSFDELHWKLKSVLQRQNTQFRTCIQPVEMLAIYLRYLSSGCTFTDLHYSYRVGILTAKNIVEEVCATIWSEMREECIPTPTCDMWQSIASYFESIANFSNCLGAVDGKHIRLTCPFDSGLVYFNYKDYFSSVLLAVADTKYRFVYVDIGSYGKESDSSIFKSKLWKSIESGPPPLPESPKIPNFFVDTDIY
ncbi:uncharacterized protein [Diabrotica undecimpunctata]|uniref:uncharacterized protein n=1 Tax=Diabrotica undecimpunctata TaxID=50387 RepID=UPI003B6341A0